MISPLELRTMFTGSEGLVGAGVNGLSMLFSEQDAKHASDLIIVLHLSMFTLMLNSTRHPRKFGKCK